MPANIASPFHYDVKRVLKQVLVSGSVVVAALAALFLLSLNLFASAIHDVLARGSLEPGDVWGLAPFPVLFGLLSVMAKRAPGGNVHVERVDPIPSCKALVLFLSPPGKDAATVDNIAGDLLDPMVRELFQGSWRMPMEAIAHHMERSLIVMVIPSSDSPGTPNGTYRVMEKFKDTVKRLSGARAHNLLLQSVGVQWSNGVDFEDGVALNEAINHAFTALHDQGISDRDILVDITGGQKLNSVIGFAIALADNRRFQYVSTRDYKISVYDVTYREGPSQ